MCRLAAFPPGTTPEQAHEIVTKFVGGNDDGVGEAYAKDGEFKINKYPYSYQQAVGKGDTLFKHMPYKGWTLAHVRFATHGGNEYKNTHPIVKGNIAVVHNGVFSQANIIRAAMADSVKWTGDTDTEVAAYMLHKHGPEGFYTIMDKYAHSPGVFLALHRDGSLVAVKCGGDLELFRASNETFILASTFPLGDMYRKSREASNGILKFDPEGHALNFKFDKELAEKKHYWSQGTTSGTNGYGRGSSGSREPFTQNDIGYACMSRSPSETSCQKGDTSGTQQETIPKKKRLELWNNWPNEEELSKMEFE